MSECDPAIHENSWNRNTAKAFPSYICVLGSPEFHRQECWHHIQDAGYAVRRFTEEVDLLDAVQADSPSAIIYESSVDGTGVIQFLNRVTELKRDVCVILVGPEIGAELVARCLRCGAFDYLAVPIAATRLMTSLQDGLFNRQTCRAVGDLSQELAQSQDLLAGERNALKQWNRNLIALNHLTQVLTGSLNSETIVQSLFTGLATLISLDMIGLAHTEPQRVVTWSRSSTFRLEELQLQERLLHRFPEGAQLGMHARQPVGSGQSETSLEHNPVPSPLIPTFGDDRHSVAIPLHIAPHKQGILHVERRQGTFTEAEFHILSTLGISLALAFRNADTHQGIQELALRDSVTGLLNRRALEEVLVREFRAGSRYKASACFLLMDLDYFKVVNDRLGHLAGDQVLKSVAALMQKAVRDVDAVGRYGGEEFWIVLPHTGLDCALMLAERLREQIERHEFEVRGDGCVRTTVSIGIAQIPDVSIMSISDWIVAADSALYDAKALGRNRVAVHVPGLAVSVETAALTLAVS